MNWYLEVLKKYVVFNGRAHRTEFWMFFLFNCIISIVLSIVESLIGLQSVLSGLYTLAVLLPSLGVMVRRLHDIGKPGLWILIGLIPIIGGIILIIFACKDSDPGDNEFGPNPKGA